MNPTLAIRCLPKRLCLYSWKAAVEIIHDDAAELSQLDQRPVHSKLRLISMEL